MADERKLALHAVRQGVVDLESHLRTHISEDSHGAVAFQKATELSKLINHAVTTLGTKREESPIFAKQFAASYDRLRELTSEEADPAAIVTATRKAAEQLIKAYLNRDFRAEYEATIPSPETPDT